MVQAPRPTSAAAPIGRLPGAQAPAQGAALRVQRERAGLSRRRFCDRAWHELGLRILENALTNVEGGRHRATPVVVWAYQQLAGGPA